MLNNPNEVLKPVREKLNHLSLVNAKRNINCHGIEKDSYFKSTLLCQLPGNVKKNAGFGLALFTRGFVTPGFLCIMCMKGSHRAFILYSWPVLVWRLLCVGDSDCVWVIYSYSSQWAYSKVMVTHLLIQLTAQFILDWHGWLGIMWKRSV